MRRVEALRAGPGAVHDCVAAIEAEGVLEPVEAFASVLIATVGKPTERLQENRWTKIAVGIPPVAWARGGAAKAKDAFPAGVRQFHEWADLEPRRHIMIAVARDLAAHSPTERAWLQPRRSRGAYHAVISFMRMPDRQPMLSLARGLAARLHRSLPLLPRG